MAVAHIFFDENSQYGRKLRNCLNLMESGDDQQVDVRDFMIQMRDGDGSQNSHYAELVKRLGVLGYAPVQGDPSAEQLAAARSLFEEFDSAFSKTSGNGAVSNVRAARDQVFAKLR